MRACISVGRALEAGRALGRAIRLPIALRRRPPCARSLGRILVARLRSPCRPCRDDRPGLRTGALSPPSSEPSASNGAAARSFGVLAAELVGQLRQGPVSFERSMPGRVGSARAVESRAATRSGHAARRRPACASAMSTGSATSSSTETLGSAMRLTKEEFAPFSSRRRTR